MCAGQERIVAVRKAVAVLSHSGSFKASLSAEQVTQLLYPHGPGAGSEIFKTPYTRQEIADAVSKAGKPDASGVVRVTADDLVYSVHTARLLAACGTYLELRDPLLDLLRTPPADTG